MDQRANARELAAQHLARGDGTGWFEKLYAGAAGNADAIPWADRRSNPNLRQWLDREKPSPGRALVVGCGLGDDAEALSQRGFTVTAFDIAPSAIDWARKRFPESKVDYRVGDATAPADEWRGAFDLVFESYTLQAVPEDVRKRAIRAIPTTIAPGGRLLVVCRARDEGDAFSPPPWPLLASEVKAIGSEPGMKEVAFEDYLDTSESAAVRRFRAVFERLR
jgi:SAM-dependent methyltransferase